MKNEYNYDSSTVYTSQANRSTPKQTQMLIIQFNQGFDFVHNSCNTGGILVVFSAIV